MMDDTLRLTEVKLDRFKAAFRPDSIGMFPFTVVIGRNGSGKSTLLEALQWLDVTIRRDAREACDRYFGMRDLVNLRSHFKVPYFKLHLTWSAGLDKWHYMVKVEEHGGLPAIVEESLEWDASERPRVHLIYTTDKRRYILDPSGGTRGMVRELDRLALSRVGELDLGTGIVGPDLIRSFWERVVFLRLSPHRLAHGSPATRKSFDPILDEEGQTLPALLNELDTEQRVRLVEMMSEILPGISDVAVSTAEQGRDTRVHYSLLERMPYQGRHGHRTFPIPAWMLSEGTRRITAILALLVRHPMPSLLCIEEIENGLDPWTVRIILRHLQSAADEGCQVILTSHSPWLLDDIPMDSIIQVRRIEGDTRYERFADRAAIQAYHPSVPAGTRYVNEAE